MNIPDIINGTFELFGGIFVLMSIIKLLHDRRVNGVSWLTIGYFASWGLWNLWYYPHLGQAMSFCGGVVVAIANTVYTILIIWYSKKD